MNTQPAWRLVGSIALFVAVFFATSFFASPATTYELRKVDWEGIGALMGALSAIGAFVAAWAAYKVGKSSADISEMVAREAKQARFRRAFAAKLAIEAELEIARHRLLAIKKTLAAPGSELQQFQLAVDSCGTIRVSELERYSGEMDLFDFQLSIRFTTIRNLRRQLEEIYGGKGKRLRQDAIHAFSQKVDNLIDEIEVTQNLIRVPLGGLLVTD